MLLINSGIGDLPLKRNSLARATLFKQADAPSTSSYSRTTLLSQGLNFMLIPISMQGFYLACCCFGLVCAVMTAVSHYELV